MSAAAPTLLHVTHWKAGSQWIYRILAACAPERIVPPRLYNAQLFEDPVVPGGIYPTVYLSARELACVPLPPDTRRFVVFRDLRDTLVSGYFNLRHSHPELNAEVTWLRERLLELPKDEGLLLAMDRWLHWSATIQRTWTEAGEPFVRFEDMIGNDLDVLERVILQGGALGVSRDAFREAVLAHRFEKLAGGRPRGVEDLGAHERKGVVGDWKEHFSPAVKEAFKARHGALLVATGYAQDEAW